MERLTERIEDIIKFSDNTDNAKKAMIQYLSNTDSWGDACVEACGDNVILFKDIRGGFCKKCGFVYPF